MIRAKTYGTCRVYLHVAGQYHEPLLCVASSPTEADAIAAAHNRKLGVTA